MAASRFGNDVASLVDAAASSQDRESKGQCRVAESSARSINDVESAVPDHVDQAIDADLAPARVANDEIGLARPHLLGALEALLDAAVAGTFTGGKARRQNFGRGSDQDDGQLRVAQARRRDDRARDVADHGPALADVVIDRRRDAVAVAVRLPRQGERSLGRGLVEIVACKGVVVLRQRGRPRDDASRKHDGGVIATRRAGAVDQRVLAGAARPDHQHQAAGPDQAGPRVAGPRVEHPTHATRLPHRHTLRTTGTWCATRTRIRSARLPVAISPRSLRPTASAGVLVTVRTAAARSMAGTASGSRKAAISKLAGM